MDRRRCSAVAERGTAALTKGAPLVPERREIQERIQKLDDASLRYMVFMEASKYVPEAIEIACDELARRRIPRLTPEEWKEKMGFCHRCWTLTTDETPGHAVLLRYFGLRLRGSEDPCLMCGSVAQTMWLCVVIPLVPLDRYRVIRGKKGTFIGRKLKDQDRPPA